MKPLVTKEQVQDFVQRQLREFQEMFLSHLNENSIEKVRSMSISIVCSLLKVTTHSGGSFENAILQKDLVRAAWSGSQINREALAWYGVLIDNAEAWGENMKWMKNR